MRILPNTHSAFTLVELIVVITILAILGTIGFLSLQGYSRSARDSERTSDLVSIGKGFDILSAGGKTFPQPDANMLTITASGTTIGYQGYAGKNVISALSLGGKFQDPTDNQYYTYETNLAQNRYQVLGLLEDGGNLSLTINDFPGIQTAYAGTYDTRFPLSKGASLGILLGTGATLNQPVQELYAAGSFTGVDVASTNIGYAAIFSKGNITSGTGLSLVTAFSTQRPDSKDVSRYDPSLVGYWDMETTILSGSTLLLKDLSNYGNNGKCYDSGSLVNCGINGQGPQSIKADRSTGKVMKFDGSGDMVDLINSGGMNFNTGDFSLSFWLGPRMENGPSSVWSWVLSKNEGYPGFVFSTYSSTLRTSIGAWFTDVISDPGKTTLPWSSWNHMVLFRKSGMVYMYVNGAVYGTPVANNYDFSGVINAPLLLGTLSSGATWQWFNGMIDDLRIYNRALSTTEIAALYNATK